MAQIVINEISQNYTYNIGSSSFATVALPITACWGPAFVDPSSLGGTADPGDQFESLVWQHFPATQAGLESFVSTYRGPASRYRLAKDYSYQMAMTLLTAGYDILVCRLCPGTCAQGTLAIKTKYSIRSVTESGAVSGQKTDQTQTDELVVKAKYPGTFGNNLKLQLTRKNRYDDNNKTYWNLVVYVIDSSGVQTAAENLVFVTDLEDSIDSSIPFYEEVESKFIDIVAFNRGKLTVNESQTAEISEYSDVESIVLSGGSDDPAFSDQDSVKILEAAAALATNRYSLHNADTSTIKYIQALKDLVSTSEGGKKTDISLAKAQTLYYKQWLYTYAVGYKSSNVSYSGIYDLLTDKLTYNPNRIISPGWDDMDLSEINGNTYGSSDIVSVSPLHNKLMEVAYNSRCATALLDVPKSLPRSLVFNESTNESEIGYAQKLARSKPTSVYNANNTLYTTHSALFAPWGQYTYVGTSKQFAASPAFLDLMIHRAMTLNQTVQYEWALPTTRKHSLNLGKFDYTVPNKLLQSWQKSDGVGINVITNIPDIGNTVWGNSTLYEVPPATYQALANLSTRYLVNAVEDVVYRCGISITFQYNNEQAYNKFYAGVTPILDTMKNAGAIDDYYVRMSADINGLDQINANTVIGKIYLVVNGVINDIMVDLVACPPGTDLNQYKA